MMLVLRIRIKPLEHLRKFVWCEAPMAVNIAQRRIIWYKVTRVSRMPAASSVMSRNVVICVLRLALFRLRTANGDKNSVLNSHLTAADVEPAARLPRTKDLGRISVQKDMASWKHNLYIRNDSGMSAVGPVPAWRQVVPFSLVVTGECVQSLNRFKTSGYYYVPSTLTCENSGHYDIQRLFPWTSLTHWLLYWRHKAFPVRYELNIYI
jgi:hypothetical protein